MATIIQNAVVLTPFRKVFGSVVVEGSSIAQVLPGENAPIQGLSLIHI